MVMDESNGQNSGKYLEEKELGSKKQQEESTAKKKPTVDNLVDDLFYCVQKSGQGFNVSEIITDSQKKPSHKEKEKSHHKKSKKEKKHKKSSKRSESKEKDRRKSDRRSRSSSRDIDSHKHKHRKDKKRKHSTSSRDTFEDERKKEKKNTDIKIKTKSLAELAVENENDQVLDTHSVHSDDDDLPVGADYRTVMHLATAGSSKEDATGVVPVDVPPKRHESAFPISKMERSNSPEKTSEWLKKVIDEKGKPSLVPRHIQIGEKKNNGETKEVFRFGPAPPPSEVKHEPKEEEDEDLVLNPIIKKTPGIGISISAIKLETTIKEEVKEEKKEENTKVVTKKEGSSDGEWEEKETIAKKKNEKKKERSDDKKDKKERNLRKRRASSTSATTNTDEELRKKAEVKKRDRRRSRSRDRKDRKKSRERERSRGRRSPERRRRSRSTRRSRSPDRKRGRRDRSQDRNKRNRRSPSRSRSRSPRRRSRSDDGRIDKKKLLEIAKENARNAGQVIHHYSSASANRNAIEKSGGKTITDIVSFCQKISQSERESPDGRNHSDDEDFVTTRSEKVKEISINIKNASQLPIRTPQERLVEEAPLRVSFPVSSGTVHKDTEWVKVEKAPVPTVCMTDQKKLVASTSLAKQKAVSDGAPLPQSTFPIGILPPPPAPPSLVRSELLPPPPRPPTGYSAVPAPVQFPLVPPPPMPPMIITPPSNQLIINEPESYREPMEWSMPRVLSERARAVRRLEEDPNDYEARTMLRQADERMKHWSTSQTLPGRFTGSTGVNILSADELGPSDPRYHSWVKKDLFKRHAPVLGGPGMRLMQKMGWRFGEGLGKDCSGSTEPLVLDVKSDRKGLATEEDVLMRKVKQQPKKRIGADGNVIPGPTNSFEEKNPVSALMEFCAKKKFGAPEFAFQETGAQNARQFLCSVIVNGQNYTITQTSKTKKDAKALICQVALQSLGVIRRDPSVPYII